MDYNMLNGGLVKKIDDQIYITNIKDYTGTFYSERFSEYKLISENIFWFINNDDKYIYYSDEKNNNKLYRFNINSRNSEQLVDSPCYGIMMKNESLYYINENDYNLYRVQNDGSNIEKIVDEKIMCYLIDEGKIYYTTQNGIHSCLINGKHREKVLDEIGLRMIKIDEYLLFSDKANQYILNKYNLLTEEKNVYEDIYPISMNTDGKHVYCANGKNGGSIYRININDFAPIRICSNNADYIHIVGNEIYFLNYLEWYKLSLLGGQPKKIELSR